MNPTTTKYIFHQILISMKKNSWQNGLRVKYDTDTTWSVRTQYHQDWPNFHYQRLQLLQRQLGLNKNRQDWFRGKHQRSPGHLLFKQYFDNLVLHEQNGFKNIYTHQSFDPDDSNMIGFKNILHLQVNSVPLNPLFAEIFWINMSEYIYISSYFSILKWHRQLQSCFFLFCFFQQG